MAFEAIMVANFITAAGDPKLTHPTSVHPQFYRTNVRVSVTRTDAERRAKRLGLPKQNG
jgi:hypothetical protein